MAGIHEITTAAPQPKRRPQPVADPRAALRAHVAKFEQLVQNNRKLLDRTESLLSALKDSRQAA